MTVTIFHADPAASGVLFSVKGQSPTLPTEGLKEGEWRNSGLGCTPTCSYMQS